jgi:hypothetical protein
MTAYVSAVKEQNDYRTIKLLPSPDKRAIAKLKAQVILQELDLQKVILETKKRKLLDEQTSYKNYDDNNINSGSSVDDTE